MTVSTTTNKVAYVGNGIATEFAIPFPFLETAHLSVYQLLNDIQTQREDWTVQNGNLIFETAPANEAQIVIMRIVPFTQETDYQENEILAAGTLERNFDSLTMQVQQLKELSERAVTVDIFDDTPAAELLPSIRSAVSDAAGYAQMANEKAEDAEEASLIATTQATIATDKANEASTILTSKASINADNFSITGREKLIENTFLGSTVVSGILPETIVSTASFYTAPEHGYIFICGCTQGQSICNFFINDVRVGCMGSPDALQTYQTVFFPLKKGDVFKTSTESSMLLQVYSAFFFAKGVG